MSAPPPPASPAPFPNGPYQQAPGPYAQAPGPYQQTPGPYAQAPAPGPYQQPPAPGPYAQPPAPGPYAQAPAPGPYPQAPAPGWPQQQQQYGGGVPAGACEACGAGPAAPVKLRGHQGFLVIMRFLRRQGVFCRTCALSLFRKMQADTMLQGWWGPMSALITPITLLINLGALSGIRRIPEPVAPGWRPPLDPGRPIFKRAAGLVGLVPLTGFGLIFLLVVVGMLAG
ncbi:hypothetical protein OIB37_17215 [Streptomyces sp. NBC_00820]|uniref:hypothetical protein n=1 Tax=Streptomyces sp. NBC_00820 TaxID=2975842 RepID=UPI002ED4B474|nr:hypothetical protein OIB37_17215 [Streptomyces sp. NBC_00820]